VAKRILFVCSGNTCRSPMAETLLRSMLEARLGRLPSGLEVTSGGVSAVPGASPTVQAVMVMAERGLDLSTHKARQVTADMVRQADLVLTMTRSHREALLKLAPEAAGRVFVLNEYCRGAAGRRTHGRLEPRAVPGDGSGPCSEDQAADPDQPADPDIADPFGGSFETYQETAQAIEAALGPVVAALVTELAEAQDAAGQPGEDAGTRDPEQEASGS